MFWTDYCEELDGNLVFLLLVTTSFSVPGLLAWSVDLVKFWFSGLTASSSFDSSSYDSREHRSLPGNASHRATVSFLQTNTLLLVVITNSLHTHSPGCPQRSRLERQKVHCFWSEFEESEERGTLSIWKEISGPVVRLEKGIDAFYIDFVTGLSMSKDLNGTSYHSTT